MLKRFKIRSFSDFFTHHFLTDRKLQFEMLFGSQVADQAEGDDKEMIVSVN